MKKTYLLATLLPLALLVGIVGASAVMAQQPPGSVSGRVYCDADYSGSYDAEEEVAGVTITLYDDDDCNYDPDLPARATASSGTDGTYAFPGLEVGPSWSARECYIVEVDDTAPELGNCNYIAWNWDYPHLYLSEFGDQIDAIADFRFIQLWDKMVNGQSWVPGLEVTAETSDTIEIVDTVGIMSGEGFQVLLETWDPDRLVLEYADWTAGLVITDTGVLTWTLTPNDQGPATLTKTFRLQPCNWTSTIVEEDLGWWYGGSELDIIEQRPVTVNKTPPDLWLTSTGGGEVSPGDQPTFTLSFGNDGGYENSTRVDVAFPPEAPFASADPPPDWEAVDGSAATWGPLDLANGDAVDVEIQVDIQAGLAPSTTMVITGWLYNHMEEQVDVTEITYHILQPALDLGDLVWYDTDADGIQDAGEPGVQNITVDLYEQACAGEPLASDTTDAGGNYLFTGLMPGLYCLQFGNIPAGWTISLQNEGADDTADSDADPVTAQIAGINLQDTDLDEDMGLYGTGSIGDQVFCDADGDGVYDAGEGIAGVAVSLYDDPGCDGVPISLRDTMDTGTNGAYLFDGLVVGLAPGLPVCYYVEVDTADPDLGTCSSPITPMAYAVALDTDNPNDMGSDFGFNQLLSLGDRVWRDADRDGIQDAGEPGMADITVDLYVRACTGEPLASDTTDATGGYLFPDLTAGFYCLRFGSIPDGWFISPQNQGADDAVDSDADPVTAQIVGIDLQDTDLDQDMGLYRPAPPPQPEPPPVVPEPSTLLLLGSAASGLAAYVGLQLRARRRQ